MSAEEAPVKEMAEMEVQEQQVCLFGMLCI